MISHAEFVDEQERAVGRLNAEIQLRHQMRLASEKMEMYELIEQAALVGDAYGRGFQEGFAASRLLHEKYGYGSLCQKEAS